MAAFVLVHSPLVGPSTWSLVAEIWPDAPCGYLHFSPFYERSLTQARRAGWVVEKIAGGHFEMLNRPDEVARVLGEMAEKLGK